MSRVLTVTAANLKFERLEKRNIKSLVRTLLGWFAANARDLPWRRTLDGYAVWVSEIMLQQTQVKTVIPYWERWMRVLPDLKALAAASPDTIHKLWEGLGYYTRVRNMQKAAQKIMASHGGRFPRDFEAILELPGIGRYTAGAISSIAFNEPRPILDGNVIRVLTRLFGIGGNPREKGVNEQLWQLAEKLVAKASALADGSSCSHFNQSLMELGALICTPRQPNCSICPVQKQCDAFRSKRVGELPNLGPRAAATARRFVAFVVEHRGHFLVRQRPAGVVNAHLWEFPNVEITAPFADPQKIAGSDLGFKVTDLEKLCVIKHSITRYRITLEAWRIKMKRHPKKLLLKGCWLAPCDLQTLAFSSAHKQVLEQACQAAPKDYVASIITARPALKPVGRHIRLQQQK